MNTPSKADIIKIKLGRAKKCLREADAMINNNFPDAAINRLYYACFYASTALLFKKDIFTKTHAGVKQMLGQHYINTGILSKDMGEFYGNLLRSRQEADYDDFSKIDPELVREYSVLAGNFVTAVQKIFEL